jgi:hypothetical protein
MAVDAVEVFQRSIRYHEPLYSRKYRHHTI